MRYLSSLACLLIALTPVAAQASSPDAMSLLRIATTQATGTAYSGRQVTALWSSDRSEAIVTQEYRAADGRERIEILMPRELRGRITLQDGTGWWHYDPKRRIAIRSSIHSPVYGFKNLELIERQYRLRVDPKPETIAGQIAWSVTATPQTRGKPRQRVWIDDATGVILKYERFHADGDPMALSYFTEIEFAPSPSALFEARFPPGTQRVDHPEETRAIDRIAAERRFGVPLPERLADGFEFEGASLVDTPSGHAAHLRYWDGLCVVSLFVAPHGGHVPYDNEPGRTLRLAGGTGRLATAYHYSTVTWRTRQVDCALMGDVSDDLLARLADSTGLTQGALAAHRPALPWGVWLIPVALLVFAVALQTARRYGIHGHLLSNTVQ